MKFNLFKYLFILFVIILVIVSVYIIRENENEINKNSEIKQESTEELILDDIRLGITEFDTMNPIISKNKNVQDISKLIFDSILTLDENFKLTNVLANECSKISETSYIIKLKENIVWQNGSKLTTKDIQFTIDRLKDTVSIYNENVKDIQSLEIIDDYTIKINLSKEVEFFEYNLTFPILSNMDNLIGTGKYKILETTTKYITLEKNTDYSNKEFVNNSKIKKIVINLYATYGEMYNAFKSNHIDVISTSNPNWKEYLGTIGFNTKEFIGREYEFLVFNFNNSLLKKTEVRKSIAYAIDRDNMVNNVYSGNNKVANSPLDYGNWLNKSENIVYSTESSRKILEENEWVYKKNVWQKTENYKTLKLNFTLVVNESNELRLKSAELIKSQLESLGITVTIKKLSNIQYEAAIQNKSYDLLLTGVNISPSPNLSKYIGENNIASYSNDEIKEISNDLKNISDEKLLQEKYNRIFEILKEDIPYIPLHFNKNIFAYNINLVGNMKPTWYNIFYNVENWYRKF